MCSLTPEGTLEQGPSRFGTPRESKNTNGIAESGWGYVGEFWGEGACLDETILRVFFLRFLSVWMPLESLEGSGLSLSIIFASEDFRGGEKRKHTKCL